MKTLLTLLATPIWWLTEFVRETQSTTGWELEDGTIITADDVEQVPDDADWEDIDYIQLDRDTQSDDGDSRWYHLKAEAGYEGYEEYRDYE